MVPSGLRLLLHSEDGRNGEDAPRYCGETQDGRVDRSVRRTLSRRELPLLLGDRAAAYSGRGDRTAGRSGGEV